MTDARADFEDAVHRSTHELYEDCLDEYKLRGLELYAAEVYLQGPVRFWPHLRRPCPEDR